MVYLPQLSPPLLMLLPKHREPDQQVEAKEDIIELVKRGNPWKLIETEN